LYDRKTNSYWTQIDGLAIVGELTGMKFTPISIDTVIWRDWKKEHPDSEVLSQDTGFTRSYGVDPYGNYYEDSFVFFPVENSDDRIDLEELKTIEDTVSGIRIRVERGDSGIVTVTNQETGEEIVKERGFWFAWYAFHPNTKLYTK
jgi:hypothetical protein